MKHIYTSVDIGSDTIKVVTAELHKNKLNLLAATSVKSRGIKKGLIVDVREATSSLKQAINEIELMLGIPIRKVIASVPSYFAEYDKVSASIDIVTSETGELKPIDGKDVVKVLQTAIMTKLSTNKEMITILPIGFKVDGKSVRDPKGIVGSKLEAGGIMVTAPKKNIYSVITLIENIGIEVVDISTDSIGCIYAFKNKELDKQVGAIINIGAETTTVSIYNRGIIIKNSIIQLGGRNIDNDIAYIYKTNLDESKDIKEKFALAHKMYASSNEVTEVNTFDGKKIKVNQLELSEICMSRLEEILTLAKKEINILSSRLVDYIIITGGTSNFANFNYIADEIFNKKITIGNIKLVGIRNNKYSACVGNIVYFISKLRLKGQEYTMVSERDEDDLISAHRNGINISNDTMLGKVFGYFFSE